MGRDLRRLLARVVYTAVFRKSKGKSRAARFAAMLNLFSHRNNKTSGGITSTRDQSSRGALARHRAPSQVSRRLRAPLLLPMAVRQSARRSASPLPNTPSERRRQEAPAD